MMNKFKLSIACFFLFSVVFSQSFKERISNGVELHKSGKYDEAIKVYESILEEDAKHPEANYELALTYSVIKEYDKAIKYCDIVIKSKADISHLAYGVKGACEDYQGTPEKAIKTFKQGIKFNPNYHQLHYSLALTSYNLRKFEDAEEALISGIKVNPYHTSSHMLMGFLKYDQKERSKSLLAFFYFLLLEPEGSRANQVFQLIEQQQKHGVQKEDNMNISISVNSDFDKNDFGTAEMMLQLLEASKHTEENENKSEFEMFSNTNNSFFKVLGEQRKGKKGFFWDFYVDFFYDLSKDKQMYEAYSHHVYQSKKDDNNSEWINANSVQIEKLIFWLKTYKHTY
ncbi:MAG TPA: tetratricopeptide repeat protein [Flavobacterium sp.]|uniref:tetratricopeptide repeat protein n=2 Tax=Flavobacterium TaxID=237 RepID=UPI0025BAEFFD|nr:MULTISPECIES: tetratricopeptide repeat protein [unclassified Flavobacterium]HRE76609.1 tetratricopeptide repeat protein [Flavobacterium sp.]